MVWKRSEFSRAQLTTRSSSQAKRRALAISAPSMAPFIPDSRPRKRFLQRSVSGEQWAVSRNGSRTSWRVSQVGKGGLPPLVECRSIQAGASHPSQPLRLSNLSLHRSHSFLITHYSLLITSSIHDLRFAIYDLLLPPCDTDNSDEQVGRLARLATGCGEWEAGPPQTTSSRFSLCRQR